MGIIFEFDEFEFDVEQQQLRRAGVRVKTDGLVLRLLEALVRNPGHLIPKRELIARVWEGRVVSDNALTVAVTRLRKALGHVREAREVVLTVHGQGYRFLPAVIARQAQVPLGNAGLSVAPNRSPFVGRERVMDQLRAAISDARYGGGSGGVIVLTGEAGIGKTRVAEMLAHEAESASVAVAWAYCRELGETPPLWPIAGLLRDAIARLPQDVTARDPRLTALIKELARTFPDLASGVETPSLENEMSEPPRKLASKHAVFDAVTRVLGLAAEHTPYLLIVDDLHRADAATLELLRYFLDAVPRTRILLLATARADGDCAANPQLTQVLNHRNCTRIALQPLSEAHVASYALAVLADAGKALRRALFEKSEGNPLFMTELVRQLRQCEQPDASTLMTPSVARELMRQRVAGLDEAANGLLSCAAVIGRSFSLPLLQAVTGRHAAELMASLDQAAAHGVIVAERDSCSQFAFTHELLRAVLYEELDAAQRRSWHQRVTRALDQCAVFGDVLPADLAFHARSALPDGDLRKTVDYCVEASNAAARVYAYTDAARYLEYARQALDLIDGASVRLRFGLLWRQAAYVRGYSVREFLPLAEQLLRLARELGTGVALAQAAMLLDSPPGFPRLPGSRTALLEAIANVPEGARCLRAGLSIRLATNASLSSLSVEHEAALEESLQLTRNSSQMDERLAACFAELYLYGGPVHRPRAAEALLELQKICNEHAATFTLPLVLLDVHRALLAVQDGDLSSMRRALERSEARCREFDIELLWNIERFRALDRINTGHAAEGRDALIELHQRALSVGPIAGTELYCAYDRCVVLADGDLPGGAWEPVLTPDPNDPPNIWALKVRALAAAGWKDEARGALSSVPPAALERLRLDREYLGTLGALARAALTLQASDYARVLYRLLSPYPEHFAVNLAFFCEGSVSQLLGMLARRFGDSASARQHLDTAISSSEQAGLTAAAAEARLERDLCDA